MKVDDHISYYISVRLKNGERGLIGFYFIFNDGRHCYVPSEPDIKKYKKYVKHKRFFSEASSDGPIDFIEAMMQEKYLDRSYGPKTYFYGPYEIDRVPERSKKAEDNYLVFKDMAKEGEPGYSTVNHVVPHCEGNGPTGINEWVRYYSFHKMDDGSYEAELDEAWYWGGSHGDGGVLTHDIPDAWFDLPYEEFLEKVLTLTAAGHFLFTVEELLSKPGLKKFFGYEDKMQKE
jgi:hypothetical protein